MTLPANYVEMKDSGIPWIGEIPTDWTLKRIKYLCNREPDSFVDGDWIESPHITDSGIRYLTTGNIGDGFFKRQGNGYITDKTFKELNCKYAYPGDLIISRLNAPYGRACILPADEEKYVLAVDNVILRTDENKSFLCYLMQCEGYQDCVQDGAKGTTMRRISRTNLGNVMLPIPPRSVQSAIVAYLDDQCAKIGEIIAEATASIEEYKAWKASIIYEAVTKGLDPDAEMKDSGIEWIGQIPSDWSVIRLKYFISGYKAGPFGSALITDRLNSNGNILVYTPEHIAKKTAELDKNLYLPDERREEMQQFIVEPGDIIFPIVGSLGRSMLITEDMPTGIINQRLAKFKLYTEQLTIEYFLWLFAKSSFYSTFIELNCRGSIIVNLTKQIVCDMPIPLPKNIQEQQAICAFLEKKCSMIDALIEEKEVLISDLETYKKSFIFETVTGKRKVM